MRFFVDVMRARAFPRRATIAAATALGAIAAPLAGPARAVDVPTDFVVENVAPGATFNIPTGIAYMPGGRLLVAEKRGRVYFVTNGVKSASPLWSSENEILNETDRGLLDVAVHPDYVTNHYVYFLYTVDPDSNGVDNNDNGFGRLVRYQVSFSDSTQLISSSRTVLMGTNWRNGPLIDSPSHTIGSLRWGRDKSLLVSIGDGAYYNAMDDGGIDGTAFGAGKTDPAEDIGAFRAQWIDCLPGKILRINPITGRGYASNPFVDASLSSIRSRVYAYGVRNPFRFTVRPGTGSPDTAAGSPGSIYIGDVGWTDYEEMNVARTPGTNFGWPCYEGMLPNSDYQGASPAHHGCSSFQTPGNPSPPTLPLQAWNHDNAASSAPFQFTGNTSIGGVFYTGLLYPATWRNKYFFADYGRNWIKVATLDGNDQLQNIVDFGDEMDGPVDLIVDPGTGNIVYTSINTGEIRRIRYTGIAGVSAVAGATPTVGAPPLQVTFSSAGSGDSGGNPITYEWVFGDGQGSTLPNPTHTYVSEGIYDAILTVRNNIGGQASDTVGIVVTVSTAFPLTPVLDNFNRANGPLGANWTGTLTGLTITANQLDSNGAEAYPIWAPTVFGPDQEAYVTIAVSPASTNSQDLNLKIQGTTGLPDARVEVRYDMTASRVLVSTYHPVSGWNTWLTIAPVFFTSGDRLGARAYANGIVKVYKNATEIGTADITAWPYHASGGRIGLTIDFAPDGRWDDFGGGSFAAVSNTPPTAVISAPLNGAFYVAAETVTLNGMATDAQDQADDIQLRWFVNLHHNTHVHPSLEAFGPSALLSPLDHEDGTGVWYSVHLEATDTGGLADTTTVNIYPEVDLRPSDFINVPGNAGTVGPTTYSFWLHNDGRMPSRIARWRIVAGGTMLAEGDTMVAALDSVYVSRTLAPVLTPGSYTLRLVADTLAQVVELAEGNNTVTKSLTVVNGPGVTEVDTLPAQVAMSTARPNPASGPVSFGLALPLGATVRFTIHDLFGRIVWEAPVRGYDAGFWTLSWEGNGERGPVPAGMYFARVDVDGKVFTRRIARLR